MKFALGQSAPRVEDLRLLQGGGRYTDDINLQGEAASYILRAPYAHARILSIDTKEALKLTGVIAIYTGEDIEAAGIGGSPCFASKLVPLRRPDGSSMYEPKRAALVRDKVAFVGDYVAFVVSETRAQAKEAAELIEVKYSELPSIIEIKDALAKGAPAIWQGCPDNICFKFEQGDKASTYAAFENAHHISRVELPLVRVAINPMEPRAAIGDYDRFEDRYTLYSGNQFPHDIRSWMAHYVLKVPESKIRIISPDMGGSFGLRSNCFPELTLVMWAAKQLGRPVKWVNERSEALLEEHARDFFMIVELALDKEGKFLGLRVQNQASVGAYLNIFGPLPAFGNLGGIAGVYKIPTIFGEVTGVFTNSGPTSPYRGAGRPEATLAIEQVIDIAAQEMKIDRVEMRRKSIISTNEFPYQTALNYNYDCGEFERNMDRALELAKAKNFKERRAISEAKGKLRGLGVINSIEQAVGMFDEGGEIRFDQEGYVTVLMGTHAHGQGHETIFRQLLSEKLGLEFEQIRYVQGDTDLIAYGHGTGGSRVSGLGSAALIGAANKIIKKGSRIAAHNLETAEVDIEFSEGRFAIIGTDRGLDLTEIAALAFQPAMLPVGMESGLNGFDTFKSPMPTFPNACHISEIEIDPETGTVAVVSYSAVDDVGTVMNPKLLKGQLHGGIVQGIAQIIGEQIIMDDSGQVLTGSFMDYYMPRADEFPSFEIETHVVPSPRNPLGIKGAGEAGTVGAVACLASAILDALFSAGKKGIDFPATPEKIWRALQ